MRSRVLRQRVPTRDLRLANARRESWIFLGYAVVFAAAAFPVAWLIRRWPSPLLETPSLVTDLWYVLLFKIVLLLLVPIALHRRLGHRLAELLFGWRPRPASLLRVAGALAAGAAINASWFRDIGAAFSRHSPGRAVALAALGAVTALLTAGLPEELFFRGMLQARLEAAFGRLPAITLTTIVFTAWHFPTRHALSHGIEGEAGNWASVLVGTGIPVAVASLVFSWAWDRFRNLPALVGAHWGVDAVPFVAFALGVPAR